MSTDNLLKEIDHKLSDGEIEEAFLLIKNAYLSIDSEKNGELSIHLGKVKRLKKEWHSNLISFKDYNIEMSKITSIALQERNSLNAKIVKSNKWDIEVNSKEFYKPEKYNKDSILLSGKFHVKSIIEFRDCDVYLKDSSFDLYRSARIQFSNCVININNCKFYGQDVIGDDIRIIDSKVSITGSIFNDLNRLSIENNNGEDDTIEITNCRFHDFRQAISINSSAEEVVFIANSVFNDINFKSLYLCCKRAHLQNLKFYDCQVGISTLLQDEYSEMTVSNIIFNDIKDVCIESWIYAIDGVLIINDVKCNDCKDGLKIKYAKNESLKEGEMKFREKIIIDNFHGGISGVDIYIDEMK